MIGVIANSDEKDAVQEFFELFKTPWEFYKSGKFYDVLLCNGEVSEQLNATLTVIYGAGKKQFDSFLEIEALAQNGPAELVWKGVTFPVYTNMSVFESDGIVSITSKASGKACAVKIDRNQHKIVRIGYDLFRELSLLLSSGQSVEFAGVPTLEIHISILRDLIIEARVPFVEIPPVPHGYDFITCLTHDIDFAGIRNHKFDSTMFGFIYRATWRTFCDALKGKIRWQRLCNNLRAVLLLPAVYFGIARDFWARFDRYLEVEKGLRSTFFFLPYKGTAGTGMPCAAPVKRAGKYNIDNLKAHIEQIISEGCEIGLHGIDAWNDSEKGKRECERIKSVTGKRVYGVRSHWLYFNKESPGNMEKAGLMYDSTCGYNDAVGFYAGTAQAFRPLGSDELLELPLLIQDSAMFYSSRMGVREDEAFLLCQNIIESVSAFGGVLVINWHGRSLAPERLWNEFYTKLLDEIKSRRIWFGTCSEVIQWFKKRRFARFSRVETKEGIIKIRLEGLDELAGPDLTLKVYGHWERDSELQSTEKKPLEMTIHGDTQLEIPIEQP